MCYIALMAVLIAICAWITIPAAVNFTLQIFGVFAALEILGGKRGTIAIVLYLLMGAIGLPVFSGFSSGVGHLLGSTGGYLLSYILVGLLYWLIKALLGDRLWTSVLAIALGLLVCYAFGTAWFMVVYARNTGAISLATALGWCVFPFILPDVLKAALAVTLARTLKKHIRL